MDTCHFLGPLIPLFRTSGDVSSEFQNQNGQPYLPFGRGADSRSKLYVFHCTPFLSFTDYCPSNADAICLPGESMDFDDRQVEENNGVTFNTSFVSFD